MPFKIEGRSTEGRASTMEDRKLAPHCLENRQVAGFSRIGAASQTFLIEWEQIDFNKRNECKYCEWRKGESGQIMFDKSQWGNFARGLH